MQSIRAEIISGLVKLIGMNIDRVRNCGEKFHMYDFIRE